jgi:hypothetical protein
MSMAVFVYQTLICVVGFFFFCTSFCIEIEEEDPVFFVEYFLDKMMHETDFRTVAHNLCVLKKYMKRTYYTTHHSSRLWRRVYMVVQEARPLLFKHYNSSLAAKQISALRILFFKLEKSVSFIIAESDQNRLFSKFPPYFHSESATKH